MFIDVIDQGISTVEGWFSTASSQVVTTAPPPVSSASVDLIQELQMPSNQSTAVGNTSSPQGISTPFVLIVTGTLAALFVWKMVYK